MASVAMRINGRVQGVFFRASARDKATELGVNGFVQNAADGGVYVEAEGNEEILKEFIAWCKIGPPYAQVMTIVIEKQSEKGYVGFQIRR